MRFHIEISRADAVGTVVTHRTPVDEKRWTGVALLIAASLLLGGWVDDAPSLARPDGGPIDPDVFQVERVTCAGKASVYTGREDLWQATFSKCIRQYGYVPLRRDIIPGSSPHD
jgi:hypothetical protein